MENCVSRAVPGRSRKRYRIDGAPIELGQKCEEGTQLRPDIVWFGEETQHMGEAGEHVAAADKVLVVGTSLSVYPAASLVEYARPGCGEDAEFPGDGVGARRFRFPAGPRDSHRAAAHRSVVRGSGVRLHTQALYESRTRRSLARWFPSAILHSWASNASRKRPSDS